VARPAGQSLGARPVARGWIDIASTVGASYTLLVAMAGCVGSVSGDVSTTTRSAAETSSALAGTRVDLIPATVDNLMRLSQACDSASIWRDRYRAEYERLKRAEMADAAIASLYRDTLAHLPSASASEPDSLVSWLSTHESQIDAKGHFKVASVPAGQYFVVAAGIGWKEVVVGRLGARVDLRIGQLLTPCGALGK
jgi:hypothetical protein